MKEVITAIALISVMTMVAEVVLSNNDLKKSVRFALGILTALVVVLPLTNLFQGLKSGSYGYGDFAIDGAIKESVEREKLAILENNAQSYLKGKGVICKVSAISDGEDILFIAVKVEKGKLDNIEEEVAKIFGVSANKVSVQI